jgi:hypothetical protein
MIKKIVICFLLLIFISCGISRQRIEIPDCLIVPNGKEIVGNKNLNAFVFENNLKNIPFQQYITTRFKSNNYLEKEIWITIEKDKFKLIFYDNDEFEKYIGTSNYTALNQETEANKTGNNAKFIAISMINAQNEDCLIEDSLYQNIAISYLKKLKDDYIKNNGQF